jgi:hypothetical protein
MSFLDRELFSLFFIADNINKSYIQNLVYLPRVVVNIPDYE